MFRWIGQVIAWMVLLATTAAITAAVLVPRIAGATPYTVTTGSMSPNMPPGTLVVAQPVPVEDIGIGDVVTYQLESGKSAVVTHRVVAVGINGAGERVLQTQGDANPNPDPELVRPVQLKGEQWYAVPHLGRLSALISNDQRQLAIYAIAALLLGYALTLWTSALRDRHRSVENGETPHAAPTSTRTPASA